jgi:hypothetical protein
MNRDVPMKVQRARKADSYADILHDIVFWLGLGIEEITPLNLDREVAPAWVRRFPVLAFLWERGRQAYLDLSKVRRSA